jgi:Cu+-exporting ATPase
MSEVANPTHQEVHDPICHMDIPADESAGSLEHDGYTYYFCSDECMHQFQANPEAAIEAEEQRSHDASA